MNKEEAVFEQLTLSDFEMWSSNNSEDKRILVRYYCLCCLFELTELAGLVNFMLLLNILKEIRPQTDPKNFILNILKEKLTISCLVGFCYLKII